MKLIVAVDEKWGIGKDGDLLLSIPDDMRFFREKTRRAVLVMGYNTLLSFPGGRPLKNRANIVLSRQDLVIEGAELVHSEAEAVAVAAKDPRCLVIGGASVYRQMMPWIDTVHTTQIDIAPASDRFFPNLEEDPAWECSDAGPWLEEGGVRYRFCTWRRRDA